jgi:hypothetical protein
MEVPMSERGRGKGGGRLALAGVTAFLLVILLLGVAVAQESELGGKLRSGEEVIVGQGEQIQGDLYLFGWRVLVEADVPGDVVAFAGVVEIAGHVRGDVIAAGGEVLVSGTVDGDVRASGGQVRIAGDVGEDVLAAGGRLALASAASVGEDVIFGAGVMRLAGDVAGNVVGSAGSYTNTGDVRGTQRVTEADLEDRPMTAEQRLLDFIGGYAVLLLAGVLLLTLRQRFTLEAAGTLGARFLPSLLYGVLLVLALVFGLLLLYLLGVALTVFLGMGGFGGPAAFLALSLTLVTVVVALGLLVTGLWVAPAVFSVWLGSLLLRAGRRPDRSHAAALVLGALIFMLVGLVPVLGPTVAALVFLLGSGALILAARDARSRPEPVPATLGTEGREDPPAASPEV